MEPRVSLPARAARKAPAADPKPTHTLLATLEAQRAANAGWLVARPPEAIFLDANSVPERTSTGTTMKSPSAALLTLRQWFEALYQAGATSQELWGAWVSWKHPQRFAKQHLRGWFDELQHKAVLRDGERAASLHAETAPEGFLAAINERRRRAREAVAGAEEELRRKRSELQAAENARKALIAKYPHLAN